MNIIQSHTLFPDHYVSFLENPANHIQPIPIDDVKFIFSSDIDEDLGGWESQGFEEIGRSEFLAKGNHGLMAEACFHAASLGATLVLVTSSAVKKRAFRRNEDGSIDMEFLLSDLPKSISPNGYFLTSASFMRLVTG